MASFQTAPFNLLHVDGGIVGCEWVVDALDCHAEHLRDLTILQDLCDQIIEDLQLHVVGNPMWHQFPGAAGVTGLYLLSESHLACHTYPEHRLATLNLYCCRSIPAWPWSRELKLKLGAERVEIVEVPRGNSLGSMDRKRFATEQPS